MVLLGIKDTLISDVKTASIMLVPDRVVCWVGRIKGGNEFQSSAKTTTASKTITYKNSNNDDGT